MHIVHLLPELQQGGVEQVVAALNHQLVVRGHTSTVISHGGVMTDRIESDGGRHITLDVCSKNPLTVPLRVRRLKQHLRDLSPDIIHVNSRVPAWLAWFANKHLHLPCVTTVHGFNSVSRYSAVMTRGDRIICVSNPVKDHIRKHYAVPEEKIEVIHCGIDMDAFSVANVNPVNVLGLRDRFDLHGKYVAASIGRITELKDFETFIHAIHQALPQKPELHGLIVGRIRHDKQDYYDRLTELIRTLELEDRVYIATDLTDIPAVYALSDVIISSSKKPESFGLTLIEALAMETPVIATRHGGPLDIIREGVNGSFYDPGDAGGLARLLVSPPTYDCAALRESVAHRFSLVAMGDAVEALYAGLLRLRQ